jgi:hypothetical protein
VAAITGNRNDDFLVCFVLLSKHFLEAVGDIEEARVGPDFTLQKFGLHIEIIEGLAEFLLYLVHGTVDTEVSSFHISFLHELRLLGVCPQSVDWVHVVQF